MEDSYKLFDIVRKIETKKYPIKLDRFDSTDIVKCILKKLNNRPEKKDYLTLIWGACLVSILQKIAAKSNTKTKLINISLTTAEVYALKELINIIDITEFPTCYSVIIQLETK